MFHLFQQPVSAPLGPIPADLTDLQLDTRKAQTGLPPLCCATARWDVSRQIFSALRRPFFKSHSLNTEHAHV